MEIKKTGAGRMIKKEFNFLSCSVYVTSVSLSLALGMLVWIGIQGFNYGIDFAGGHEVQLRFSSPPTVESLRAYIVKKGFLKPSVQTFGDDREFLILIGKGEDALGAGDASGDVADQGRRHEWVVHQVESLVTSLKQDFSGQGVEIRRVDSVGPQIGSELRTKGLLAVFYSLIMILIYVGLRFDYKFSPPAVICLFHDAVWTMWIFTVFNLVVNVQTLAALLAIIGYSLNDTIVTFDRIRENQGFFGKKMGFAALCNRSINDVLSRTLLTSLTTMLAVGVMWFFTDGVIKDFAFTLGIGVIVGTYSSIYVATPLVVFIHRLQQQKSLS